VRSWIVCEKEVYVLVWALKRWGSGVGFQKVILLSDHNSLQHWCSEALDVPSGPVWRRARWHEWLSRFDIQVGYIAGKSNTIADILSRWAYRVNRAKQDVTVDGSEEDHELMQETIQKEENEERQNGFLLQVKPEFPPPRKHPCRKVEILLTCTKCMGVVLWNWLCMQTAGNNEL
jgi:hypothetical protein